MGKQVNISVVENGFEVSAQDDLGRLRKLVFTSWVPLRKFLEEVLGKDGLVQFAAEDVPGAKKRD